jgi:O-antigen ligase
MLATFKEVVLPLLVYASVWGVCLWALVQASAPALFAYAVLSPLPMLWYPAQHYPLGALTLTLLVASVLVGNALRRPRGDPPAPLGGFILFLIFASYLALWNSSLRYGLPLPISGSNELFKDWKNYAMMLALYFAAFQTLRTPEQLRRLVMIVAAVLLLMSWREIANFSAGASFHYGRRSNGPFWMLGMGANHFGAFIAHFSVFVLGIFAVDKQVRWRRWLMLGTFVISLYPLFYSYSRGAYVAVLAALVVLGVLRWRMLLVGVALLAIFWQTVLPQSVVDRIQMTDDSDGNLEESAALRFVMWTLAKHLFSEHPAFGIGFDGFWFASDGLPLRNVHNYFLQTAAEQGIFGLLLIALLLWKAVRSGWRLYRSQGDDFSRGMGLGLIACTTALAVTNLFGDRFSQLELGGYFWLLLGAVDRAWLLSSAAATAQAAAPAGATAAAAPVSPAAPLPPSPPPGHRVQPHPR